MCAEHIQEMNDTQFKTLMNVNQIFSKRFTAGVMYYGIKKAGLVTVIANE